MLGFWQRVWCWLCALGHWSFPAIHWICIQLNIFWVCSWVASLQLQIVMVIMHLPGIYLFGSSHRLSFSLLLSITLSRFSCFLLIKFMISSDILYTFRQFIILLFRNVSYAFLLLIQAIDTFFRLVTKAWTAIDRLSVMWKSYRTDKMKRSFFQAVVVSKLLHGCTTWTLTKRMEKKLDGNYTRMLRAVLNKSWKQHPTKHQLYGHQPPIMKTIKVRRLRHIGHCWRNRDELIRDVLQWNP